MLREVVAGFVTVATTFIGAGIVYQIVKKDSQSNALAQTGTVLATNLAGDLFK